ncbi:TauD/TfdA family dioxygenase [Nannocystaceae bacterium ST9]
MHSMVESGDSSAREPLAWRREVDDPSGWVHRLDPAQLEQHAAILANLRGRPIDSLAPSDVPSRGPLAEVARTWRRELSRGRGFVLVRGFPIATIDPAELALAYVILGLYFGRPVPQNLAGERVTHVRDTGADPSLASTRLYTTRAEQDFHTDGADVIGLLCLHAARSGGASRIASSTAIVAAIERTRPDLFEVLARDFPWHYQEPGTPARFFMRPIVSIKSGPGGERLLNTFFIPWYIRRSQELAEAPRLSAAQHEAIEAIEALANDPATWLDMHFEPGDVQWLKNAAILHKRTAYEDHDLPEQKRHLLRLWLSAPDFADGDARLRRGVTDEDDR